MFCNPVFHLICLDSKPAQSFLLFFSAFTFLLKDWFLFCISVIIINIYYFEAANEPHRSIFCFTSTLLADQKYFCDVNYLCLKPLFIYAFIYFVSFFCRRQSSMSL